MNATVANVREVERVVDSHVAPVGTFTVRRALPDQVRQSVGPWVFLDHFGPFTVQPGGKDGVGAHPHAGIETVTYLLEGRNEHRDSAGHTGIVSGGGAQWMTAGRGIVHAERPLPEGDGPIVQHGIQLWTTLPRALKMMPPRYQRIDAADIPKITGSGFTVRVVAGKFDNASSPANALMPLFLWHVTVEAGKRFSAAIQDGFEAAAYIIDGSGRVNGRSADKGKLAILSNGEGGVELEAGPAGFDVLLLGGAPAEGPLVFHGPFVMNSIEQIRYAEKAYLSGQMGQVPEA